MEDAGDGWVRSYVLDGRVQASIDAGEGPSTNGALLVMLADCLIERMGPVIQQLDDQCDAIEVEAIDHAADGLRGRLADLRRQAIALRRHMAPQREALNALCTTSSPLLADADRLKVREISDRVTRYVEDLDAELPCAPSVTGNDCERKWEP